MKKGIVTICSLAIMILFAGMTFAATPKQPTYGTANVDGNFNEWDLTADHFANMYESGLPNKAHLSDLYLRYDNNSNVLYTLVLRKNNSQPDLSPQNAWIKIYELGNLPRVDGNSGDNGVPPDFKWIYEGSSLLGFEASFSLGIGAYQKLEANMNMKGNKTSSTGKEAQGYIQLGLGNKPGTIIIEKQTLPDGAMDTFTFTGDVAGSIADGEQIVVSNLMPGIYTAQELVPEGWILTSIVLDDKNSYGDVITGTATIRVESEETVKAIFTNKSTEPTYGTANVDGDSSEWDLMADHFANMYEAGDPEKAHLSNLYLRYDCNTNVLYVLVLRENSWLPELKPNEAWIKIYELANSPQVDGNSGDDGVPPDFKWVYDGPTLIGYEASFMLQEGVYKMLEAHLNIKNGKTSSSGKKAQGFIQLVLDCPEYQPGTIIIEKQTYPDGAMDAFTFTGDAAGSIADGGQIVVSKLMPGTYTAQEVVPDGWILSSIVLDDNNSTGDVNTGTVTFRLESGETVKAVFTNKQSVLKIEKSAKTSYIRTYNWTIEKTVMPEKLELCDDVKEVKAKYKVVVDKTGYMDGSWAVMGTIKITNPTAFDVTITDIKDVVDGVTATISGVNLPYSLPAGQTLEVPYSANLPDGTNRINTVTVTTSGKVLGGSATADVIFSEPTKIVNAMIHVDDTNGMSWEFTDDGSVEYEKTFTEVGTYKNIATIQELKKSDDATVTVVYCDAYQLDVQKTAMTGYKRIYNWTVKKSVTPETFVICEEDEVVAQYTVTVDKTGFTDGFWTVSGKIKVMNNTPVAATITGITDVVDGVTATITGVTFPYNLAAGHTLECQYSANLPDATRRINKVTVTTSGQVKGGYATADVIFTEPTNIINSTIHVDDSNGMNWEFTDDGVATYEKVFNAVGEFKNTVIIRETGGQGEGQSSTAIVKIAAAQPPVANFKAEPLFGIAPLEVQFTDLSEFADGWEWNFGDGNTSNERNPKHVYSSNPKHVTVSLRVWNCAGEDTKTIENYITVFKPTEVNFEAAPLAGLHGFTVQFNNFTGGNANHYEWNYGDGVKEYFSHGWTNKVNPTHKYENPGEYTVSLKAWGDGGEDILMLPGAVYADSNYNYLNLNLVSSGKTYPGDGWQNAIDHDIYGSGCKVSAEANDAWAVFKFADDKKYSVRKLRLLADTIEPYQWGIHFVKEFEVWTSDDGVNFELGYSGESTKKTGVWEIFRFPEPLVAKYLKMKLTSARGTSAAYRELVEIQFFGNPYVDLAIMQKTGIEQENEVIPTEFGLGQNYPNPFNPETSISYQLPEVAQVTLAIYSIEGKLIQTLINGQVTAGVHRVVWNGMDEAGVKVSSGLYLYRFQATDQDGKTVVFTRKMTLMK
ncbi:PKD domain-containing protein [candidate division KSB1 bacterium]|nr:PKD domain-containing protein [candidate division KSB1 bacterium]